jgi:hypothetical protein
VLANSVSDGMVKGGAGRDYLFDYMGRGDGVQDLRKDNAVMDKSVFSGGGDGGGLSSGGGGGRAGLLSRQAWLILAI